MSKQTAVTEITERFLSSVTHAEFRKWFATNKDRLLQMEREQIEGAWWAGHDRVIEESVIHPSEDCDGYYTQTYAQYTPQQ